MYYNTIVCFVLLTLAIYLWFKKKYLLWSNKGIFSPSPIIPIGHIAPILTGKSHMLGFFVDVYKKYKSHGLVGLYAFHIPLLLVTDLNISSKILVSDFGYFNSHGLEPQEGNKNPMAMNLFSLSGEEWKLLRNKLAPLFTVGKVKALFGFMDKVADRMVEYLEPLAEFCSEIEPKDLISRFGIDVISSAVFGIESNSFEDPNPPLKYYGQRSMQDTWLEMLCTMTAIMCPPLARKLGVGINKPDVTKFFVNLVEDTVKRREEAGIDRDDVLGLLLKLRNNTLTDDEGKPLNFSAEGTLSLTDITAQAYIFFVAGYETSSSAASFTLYELARRPEIQEKARQEILQVLSENGGKLSYESIMGMEYLGNIVSETLRMYPTVPTLFRQCLKDYRIPGMNVTIEKGTMVFCPINAFHNDPDIFPNPEVYDPDRFCPGSKPLGKIYMPFGQGPRTCLAQNMGHLEVRLALAKLLSKYKFSSSAESLSKPIKYDVKSFLVMAPEKGIRVTVSKIKEY